MSCWQKIRTIVLSILSVALSDPWPLAAAERLRVSYTAPGPQHGLLWLGDTAGVFKKNGLDDEIIYMPGNI